MATHRDFDSLGRALDRRAQEVEKNATRTVRKAALVADQVVVVGTRVKTGRARSNWYASTGIPVTRDEPFDGGEGAATSKALGQARSVVARWTPTQGSIFLTNSVPYITKLDELDGMVARAIGAAQASIANDKLLES